MRSQIFIRRIFLVLFYLQSVDKILKTHQSLHRCSIGCIFCSEKNLYWYYHIFNPKELLENTKMSKQFLAIFDYFWETSKSY